MKILEAIEAAGFGYSKWAKHGKERYYLSGDRLLEKANAYVTPDADDGDESLGDAYVSVSKSYNGAVAERLQEIRDELN